MAQVIYGLCALTALMCAWLLLLAYRRTKYGLLFWSGLFFTIAAANNVFLVVDKLVFPSTDLTVYRYGVTVIAFCLLLPGLIFERE